MNIKHVKVFFKDGTIQIFKAFGVQDIPAREVLQIDGLKKCPAKLFIKQTDLKEIWIPKADIQDVSILENHYNDVVRVVRVTEDNDGTFGTLSINGTAFCNTLEPPDRDNQRNISSIPAGVYEAKRVKSPRYGDTFMIVNVPNRSHILIHAGNVVEHTKGCLILGQYFGKLKGNRAVLNSGATFKLFMSTLDKVDGFIYEVSEGLI